MQQIWTTFGFFFWAQYVLSLFESEYLWFSLISNKVNAVILQNSEKFLALKPFDSWTVMSIWTDYCTFTGLIPEALFFWRLHFKRPVSLSHPEQDCVQKELGKNFAFATQAFSKCDYSTVPEPNFRRLWRFFVLLPVGSIWILPFCCCCFGLFCFIPIGHTCMGTLEFFQSHLPLKYGL